jgi:transcriptional regulator
VPTWDYSAVHLTGTIRVHTDREWLRAAVSALTDVHEAGRARPWAVADAPDDYIMTRLGGLAGIELAVTGVEAKAKLSQNRSEADRRGVVAGLAAEGRPGADAVAASIAHGLDAASE